MSGLSKVRRRELNRCRRTNSLYLRMRQGGFLYFLRQEGRTPLEGMGVRPEFGRFDGNER